jgi:tubulin polyglutamylase TTLL6/13
MCTVQPSLRHYLNIPSKAQYDLGSMNKNPGQVNSMCFEILGFDILIDDKFKPWLIEINHAPSFSTDTPLDFKMKKDVIADAVQLLGMTYKGKKKMVKSHKSNINKRMHLGKRLTNTVKKESGIKKNVSPFKQKEGKPTEINFDLGCVSPDAVTKKDPKLESESGSEEESENEYHN